MYAEHPLYSDTGEAKCDDKENSKQSGNGKCLLTDDSSILTKGNEILGKYNEDCDNYEHEKEQKEKPDKEHHAFFITHNIKPPEETSKYVDTTGIYYDISDSQKFVEDHEYYSHSSGSISSQEDNECFDPTSGLAKTEDIGYFSHSSQSTSPHSSSSEKLEQDSDQILNEDDDDYPGNISISSSSEEIKVDRFVVDEVDHLEDIKHISSDLKDDCTDEWHAPAAPSNSPTDQEKSIASQNYRPDEEEDIPLKFGSVNEYDYEKTTFSKKYEFKPIRKISFINQNSDESKSKDFHNMKPQHLGSIRGKSTPPLPPNTLAPPSQVTSTSTSVLVRYPSPNTTAIYYDSLPDPKEDEFSIFKDKKKRVQQDEFINILRDKLQKLQLLTEVSQKSINFVSDVCNTSGDKGDDNAAADQDDNDDDGKDDDEDDDDDECDDALIRPPLQRQSSFTFKLPKKNLFNLTEVLSGLHSTQLELKKCEILPSKESLTEDTTEETNTTDKTLKKSSSLKYNKTPPDQKQQSKKKIVKFADVFGMDLIEVRTFMAGAPAIARSSFSDLQVELPSISKTRSLRSLFDAPISKPNFWDRVDKQKVCLEQMFIGKDLSVKGIIRVLNISCEKCITIRHSFDNWKNYHETTATYLSGSSDGRTDQFSFLLWGNFLQDNGTLVFCICYQTAGQEFWDNNHGEDYKLQCYAMPSHVKSQERSSRSRQQPSHQQLAQTESLYSNFERLREHSPADPWLHRYL